MSFRIQDLMIDVWPGGYQMANPRCSCQISADVNIQRELPPPGEEDEGSAGDLDCLDTLLDPLPPSGECPDQEARAYAAELAGLAALKSELRRALQG